MMKIENFINSDVIFIAIMIYSSHQVVALDLCIELPSLSIKDISVTIPFSFAVTGFNFSCHLARSQPLEELSKIVISHP